MKTSDTNTTMPRLQTINECLREAAKTCPAHSNGKPDVPVPITSINVRFAPDLPHQFELNLMKETSPAIQAPFRDLMQHPEKMDAALRTAKSLLSAPRARSNGATTQKQTRRQHTSKTKQHQEKL